MMLGAEVWITAAARTPITGRSRGQAALGAGALAARAVSAVAGPHPGDGGVRPGPTAMCPVGTAAEVGTVIAGNCTGPGGNLGRIAALGAGLGVRVPGWTVDAQCGSGLAAVLQAAQHAGLTGRPCVAVGVESPSTAPERRLDGVPYTQAPMVPAGWEDPDLTDAADRLAAAQGITRSRQEAFAARSHRLARAASAHRPADDDGPRPLGVDHLARFPQVFAEADPMFAVTGATAARIADGAAAVRVECAEAAPASWTRTSGDVGRADSVPGAGRAAAASSSAVLPRPCRIVAAALTGSDPVLPGIAPVAAVERVLSEAGDTLDAGGRIAVVEVVEAYAAQVLAVLDGIRLSRPGDDGDAAVDPRVNARGGALALGHPWGASGAVAVLQAVQRLQEHPAGARALVTAAVAGGMGIAMTLEVS